MKTCYVDMETRSIADLIAPGELAPGWCISRINVPEPHRGKGNGTKILKRILADADAEGRTLWLEVHSSGPLDNNQLIDWYTRHGFILHSPTGYLVRPRRA